MAIVLFNRLQPVYDPSPATRTTALQAGWPTGGFHNFGNRIADVKAFVVHVTAGWPSRDKAGNFVTNFTDHAAAGGDWGIGTQFFISGDGTVFREIDLPLLTYHAEFVNSWTLGVETGKLSRTTETGAFFINSWRRLPVPPPTPLPAEDIPGANIHVIGINGEVLISWWTTTNYSGPGRLPSGDRTALFTEWQYRSWARLGRYLCEEFSIPRNFPLLPYEMRPENMNDPERFRKIVLADPAFPMLVRKFAPFAITEADFELANLAALRTDYRAAVQTPADYKQHNLVWRAFFNAYRGVHGHGFCGSITRRVDDHDCPGDLFDWHRFAREVWDWWWHPFDFNAAGTSTNVPIRGYRQARRDTPLDEHYFEDPDVRHLGRSTTWFVGAAATPETFRLEPGSPVYAPANGRLVAARYFDNGTNPSTAFILVRHEIYHHTNAAMGGLVANFGIQPFQTENIDYDREPSFVYSLVMHLGRPAGMSFDQVSAANPDWLNRVLMRLLECERGVPFSAAGSGIAEAVWNSRPPGQAGQRPTVREAWRFDRDHNLRRFIDELKAGRLALGPAVSDSFATPIEVLLGDYLGVAGLLDRRAGADVHGIRLEVFSKDLISTAFEQLFFLNTWPVPQPVTAKPPVVLYKSDWLFDVNPVLQELLALMGIDAGLVNWWPDVQAHLAFDNALPLAARLPRDGIVWHYRPHDFMRWLNQVTWRSEWLKYRVTDAAGTLLPPPAAPRSRRI